jgi:hypothetical protein
MILKELLDLAQEHLKGLSTLQDPDFRLEQAEYDEGSKTWDIVVSYLVENTNKRSITIAIMPEFQFHRIYKKIRINDKKEIVGFYIFNNKE